MPHSSCRSQWDSLANSHPPDRPAFVHATADVSGNGSISAFDAGLVLRKAVLLPPHPNYPEHSLCEGWRWGLSRQVLICQRGTLAIGMGEISLGSLSPVVSTTTPCMQVSLPQRENLSSGSSESFQTNDRAFLTASKSCLSPLAKLLSACTPLLSVSSSHGSNAEASRSRTIVAGWHVGVVHAEEIEPHGVADDDGTEYLFCGFPARVKRIKCPFPLMAASTWSPIPWGDGKTFRSIFWLAWPSKWM